MSDTRAAIDAGNQNFMATFGQQDAAGMASLYTANGQLLPANSDVVSCAAGRPGSRGSRGRFAYTATVVFLRTMLVEPACCSRLQSPDNARS